MPKLFEQAVEKARNLSENEREAIAQIILDEIEDEAAWRRKFRATVPRLDELAAKAIEADDGSETAPLVFPDSE